MAQRTHNPDRIEMARLAHVSDDSDDGVQREKLERDSRVGEIDLSRLERLNDSCRQCVSIDFQSDAERLRRSELRDWFVDPERVSPQLLVAERVKTKDVSAGKGILARGGPIGQ